MEGFYRLDTDIYSELKCYVNLSTLCFETISSDMRFFSLYKEKISFSGFINTVIKNFYMNSKSSVWVRINKKKDELDSLLDEKYKNVDKEIKANIKKDLLEKYHQELVKENMSYPKGSGHYFRINLDVAETLNDNVENSDIEDAGETIGNYFKIILEEYASLPQSERIRIFYKEIVDTIEDAIANGNGIKVIQKPFERFDKKNRNYVDKVIQINKYYVKPYKLVSDDAYQYLYLVGLSKPVPLNDEDEGEFEPHSFRISLFQRVTKLVSMNGFISKENKSQMDKMLAANGPQVFIDPEDPEKMLSVKVRFTSHGLETLKRISYGRPKSFEKIDENTYVFKTGFYQARNYFWRFAHDVEILEPIGLRESVKKILKLANKVYEGE